MKGIVSRKNKALIYGKQQLSVQTHNKRAADQCSLFPLASMSVIIQVASLTFLEHSLGLVTTLLHFKEHKQL